MEKLVSTTLCSSEAFCLAPCILCAAPEFSKCSEGKVSQVQDSDLCSSLPTGILDHQSSDSFSASLWKKPVFSACCPMARTGRCPQERADADYLLTLGSFPMLSVWFALAPLMLSNRPSFVPPSLHSSLLPFSHFSPFKINCFFLMFLDKNLICCQLFLHTLKPIQIFKKAGS